MNATAATVTALADTLGGLKSHPDPIVRGTLEYERTVDHLLEVWRRDHARLVKARELLHECFNHIAAQNGACVTEEADALLDKIAETISDA